MYRWNTSTVRGFPGSARAESWSSSVAPTCCSQALVHKPGCERGRESVCTELFTLPHRAGWIFAAYLGDNCHAYARSRFAEQA